MEQPLCKDRFNLQDVVKGLRDIFAHDTVDVDQVKKLLKAYTSDPADWEKFCKFDPTKYTRNLLDSGNGKYNVIVLCWSEGQGSPIHAHADSHCFVKVLDGKIRETLYEWPKKGEEEHPMAVKKQATAEADDVCYINDSIGLHRMENPSHTEPAVTLHVYVPAYQECLTFDERTGHSAKCQVVFQTRFDTAVDFASERTVGDEASLQPANQL